ncbi:MAG TPA: DUF3566 domain-containing protein [Jatrophihabitans sp.]|nr:DUF3566 domain-containing protein [Jatrophihabitans sp.]
MTEGHQPPGYQPPTSRGSGANADQDTTTLPRMGSQRGGSQPSDGSYGQYGPNAGGWSAPSLSDEPRRPEDGRGGDASANGGIGARLAAAASAAASTATSAASSAKGAIRDAANQAEANAARQPRRSGRTGRQPRRARLTLSHLNVYSIFKFSCVLAIALFFVWLIMIGVLYGILDVSGVFSKVNDTVHTISGDGKTNDVVTGSLVFGGAIIIGVVNIVLFIALSTIGAMVYNLCADLVGGAEVTLSERE